MVALNFEDCLVPFFDSLSVNNTFFSTKWKYNCDLFGLAKK